MSLKKIFILVIFIAAILMAFGFQNSSEHKVLFEKAKFTMETKGDLKGAIKLFNEIVKKYPDEREYAAKSQLYIGLCYEKLGLEQAKFAQKAFQKVVDNYPERQQEVAVAKERISVLSRALERIPSKPTFRKIRIPANPGNGVLSPDGKKLAFASEGCLWIVPIRGKVDPDIAGAPIKLTEQIGVNNLGNILSWSADGKWIAFNALENEKMEIYIIPSSGGEPKKVLVDIDRDGYGYDYRLSLSPDGKVLAFASYEEEEPDKAKKNYIYTIPVEGGTAKKLTDAMSTQPAFSPDGKKIAYVKRYLSEPGKTQTDVWVIPASGGSPVQVSNFPSGRGARSPVWSPDGKMIAFIPPGIDGMSKELWIVPVAENGKPLAPPSKIELPLETYQMVAGWTPDSKIGLQLMNPEHNALYTVPASGGKAVQITPAGWPENPRWSPDGKRIYFRGFKDGPNISSVPAGGGEVTIVLPFRSGKEAYESAPGGGNDISPDGKKLVFSGGIRVHKDNIISYEVDIYTMPTEGGEPIKITKSPGQDRFPCWSPDGKRVAFIRYSEPSKDKKTHIMNICIVSAEGGDVRQITSESDKVFWSCIDWSPDGKSIAYFSKDNNIKVIPVEDGEPRVMVHVDKLSNYAEMAWSPDGKKLAFTCKGKILIVGPDGGEPFEVKTGMSAEVAKIGWSPDGKKIAFAHWTGGDHELWLMEDFLSLIKK